MTAETQFILALNCGSSSIKFALYEAQRLDLDNEAAWSGAIDGIGTDAQTLHVEGSTAARVSEGAIDTMRGALERVRHEVDAWLAGRSIGAIGHRVVHGGGRYIEPVLVDHAVLAELSRFIPLAPLHQPFALEAIRLFAGERSGPPQIACFDTAFHHTIDDVETMFALPRAMSDDGIRRYGFHGLSYQFVARAIHRRHGMAASGRTLVAHLGSGASLCVMRDLRSVATTMGFSVLDGLMMGTRCGALDPGVVLYLLETKKLAVERVAAILYHESGLLGVSAISSDPRVLFEREREQPAAQALALYVRSIVRETWSLASAVGGLDMLVFTAGIGQHSAEIRQRVCAQLQFLGVELDAAANAANATTISTSGSRVLVAVEPTNEEWILARAARAFLPG